MVELKVLGLALDNATKTPILVLRPERGEDLPLWIGGVEAMSISLALSNAHAERPLTHDLAVSLIEGMGARLDNVAITTVKNGVFYAIIELSFNGGMIQLDSRPSDAIALALRMRAPIRATEEVMEQAPRERFRSVIEGLPPLPDEAGEIVRRSLKQAEQMLADQKAGEQEAGKKEQRVSGRVSMPGKNAGDKKARERSASVPVDDERLARTGKKDADDAFARLLRDLEPATKNRM